MDARRGQERYAVRPEDAIALPTTYQLHVDDEKKQAVQPSDEEMLEYNRIVQTYLYAYIERVTYVRL